MGRVWRILAPLAAAALLLAPAASLAQPAPHRIGTVDFNQLLTVARSVNPPGQQRQNIVQSIRTALAAQQNRLDADMSRLQRDANALDQNTLRQRQTLLQQAVERLSRRTAELQGMINAANAPAAPAEAGAIAYANARLGVGAVALLDDIDVVVENPVYQRPALDLTARAARMLRGQ